MEPGKESLMPSAFGGVGGRSGETVEPLSTAARNLAEEPAWVWLGSPQAVLFEVTLSKPSLYLWEERELGQTGQRDIGQEACGPQECGGLGTCGSHVGGQVLGSQ